MMQMTLQTLARRPTQMMKTLALPRAIPLPSADDIMTVLREVRWLRGCIDGVPVWSYTRLEKVAILASLDGIANNLQHFTYQQPGWISTGADEEGPW